MELRKELFLQAYRAALESGSVDWDSEMQPQDWAGLFAMAAAHHVLPMVYETVISCPGAENTDKSVFAPYKRQVIGMVSLQAVKTDEFLRLLSALRAAGVTPLVVKGLICRERYPKPDYRISTDEDLLIPAQQFPLCHRAMLDFGMRLSDPAGDLSGFEITYDKSGSPLRVELHKQLFPPDSEAYGELNRFFTGVHERAVTESVQGTLVPAMCPTDHLLYLILHAYKHFLHGGFGIRQVSDIALYANARGKDIDWAYVLSSCREIHAELFTAALLRIGEKYLTFQPDKACCPGAWRAPDIDERALLEDLLDSGVFGTSSESRKHSSTMTLGAVSARKRGRKSGSLFSSLFPSAKSLSGRYPYLKTKPWLLPAAWVCRIVRYGKETAAGNPGNTALDAVKIGNQRVELLKQYGILPQ